jgi:hypothetical protein
MLKDDDLPTVVRRLVLRASVGGGCENRRQMAVKHLQVTVSIVKKFPRNASVLYSYAYKRRNML